MIIIAISKKKVFMISNKVIYCNKSCNASYQI